MWLAWRLSCSRFVGEGSASYFSLQPVKKREGYLPLSSCRNYSIWWLKAGKGNERENDFLVCRRKQWKWQLAAVTWHFVREPSRFSLISLGSGPGVSVPTSRFCVCSAAALRHPDWAYGDRPQVPLAAPQVGENTALPVLLVPLRLKDEKNSH